jgi:hypothetical protein
MGVPPAVCLNNITKTHTQGANEVRALDDLSLTIPAQHFAAVLLFAWAQRRRIA